MRALVAGLAKQVNEAPVFNIQYYSIHDGPGIRTVVFLKGCPLGCIWCCNPESRNNWPELGFRKSFCDGCGRCIGVCPRKALSFIEARNTINIERAACDDCGACVQSCTQGALITYGQRMALKQVMDEISKDAPFYRRSGGGVTISGGEPLSHPSFLSAILRGCREQGLHTAIETSGYCSPRTIREISDKVDLVMFDLKVMDSDRHLALTGKRNRIILNNARLLAKMGTAVQPRMPLLPGLNDSEDNISLTASFLRSVGWSSIELMPYHQLGRNKSEALGRPCKMGDRPSARPEDAERACKLFKSHGVESWASI